MFEPMSIKCQWADEHGSHHNGEEMADYIEIIPDLESTKEGDNAPKVRFAMYERSL